MWCFSSIPFHFQILPSKWGGKKHDLKKYILNWIDNRFSCKYVVFGLYSRNQTWVALLRFLVPVKGWNSLRHSSEVMLATLSKDSDCSIGSLTLNFRSPLRFPNPYVFYRLFFLPYWDKRFNFSPKYFFSVSFLQFLRLSLVSGGRSLLVRKQWQRSSRYMITTAHILEVICFCINFDITISKQCNSRR